jgi:NDP-sugar pyrophosphorylase family protein
MTVKAVILAAGKGSRMLPLTETTPKPLLPSIENSLLLSQINFLRTITDDITVTIGYKKELLIHALKLYSVKQYIYGKDKENAFWINSKKFSNYTGPLIVCTCDNMLDINLEKLIEEYYSRGEKNLLVGLNKYEKEADKVNVEKHKIIEIGKNVKSDIILSGIQILNIHDIQKYNQNFSTFHNLWKRLATEGKLILSKIKIESWSAIDTVEELHEYFNS